MKKIIVSAVFVTSLVGYASALEQGTSTNQMPPALPPMMMTTGSSTLDAQVKSLRMEYEVKMKALQQEYLTKLKELIGERKEIRKQMMASSTRPVKPEDGKMPRGTSTDRMMGSSTEPRKEDRPRMPNGGDDMRLGGPRPEVEGASSSTVGNQLPNGNAWGSLKRFLGL